MSDSVFIIGAANVGYLIFNFLNLNAGWIHRMDRPRQERPWRAPTWILAAGAVLSFVNLAFMGFGADVYGAGTLKTGLIFAALIVPVFVYRHYIQDKGTFPREMAEDLETAEGERIVKRAGIWPYVVLAGGNRRGGRHAIGSRSISDAGHRDQEQTRLRAAASGCSRPLPLDARDGRRRRALAASDRRNARRRGAVIERHPSTLRTGWRRDAFRRGARRRAGGRTIQTRGGRATFNRFRGTPDLLGRFRTILAASLMGTRLYVAGPESFIGLAMKIAIEFNLNKDEIRAEECGTLARRVYCIHCRATTESVRTNIVRCVGCERWLLVRDHYSRRLAAYMGVMVDAEAPGELPPLKEVFL